MGSEKKEGTPEGRVIFGVCVGCGEELHYPPIKLPVTRPKQADRVAVYDIAYRTFCLDCAEANIRKGRFLRPAGSLRVKINLGEMAPLEVWEIPTITEEPA